MIKVRKLDLIITGTYNQMYNRSYTSFCTNDLLNTITGRLESNGDHAITPALLSGVAGQVLNMSPTPGGKVYIPNGYDTRRLRFMLTVEVIPNGGNPYYYYFQGYTSHYGVSASGHIDPQMEFIINSFIRVVRITVACQYGNEIKEKIVESAQLINGQFIYDDGYNDQNTIHKIRPFDVISGVETSFLQEGYNNHVSGDILDTRTLVNQNTFTTNRANNDPNQYLYKIVDGYTTANKLQAFGQSDVSILDTTRNAIMELNPTENVFLRTLQSISMDPNRSTFTIGQLEHIDRDCGSVINVLELSQNEMRVLPQTGQMAGFTGSTVQNQKASMLLNTIPAGMLKYFLTKVEFTSTNGGFGGAWTTYILNGKSVVNTDLSKSFAMFKRELETSILLDVTYGGQDTIEIHGRFDIFGDNYMRLTVNGESWEPYCVPGFADALVPPILARRKEYDQTVSGIDAIMTVVNEMTLSNAANGYSIPMHTTLNVYDGVKTSPIDNITSYI